MVNSQRPRAYIKLWDDLNVIGEFQLANCKTRMVTDGQFEILKSHGIDIKPYSISYKTAFRLISYILQGNGTQGKTTEERASLAREVIEKWVGKKVRYSSAGHMYNGRTGVVESLRAYTYEETRLCLNKIPMAAVMRWDATDSRPAETTRTIPGTALHNLEIIQD